MSEPARSTFREFVRDAAIFGAGKQAGAIAALVLVPLLTRRLGPSGLGLLDVIARGMTMVTILSSLGLDTANLALFNTVEGVDRARLLATSVVLRAAATALAFGAVAASAPTLAPLVAPGSERAIVIACGAAFAIAMAVQVTDLLRLARRQWTYTGLQVAGTALHCAGTVVLVGVLGHGPEGFLVSLGLASAIVLPVSLVAARDLVVAAPSREHARRLVAVAATTMPAALATCALATIDRYALLASATLHDVGILSMAGQLVAALAIFTNAFEIAWNPYALSIRDRPDAPATYAHAGRFLVLVLGVATLGLTLFGRELLWVFTTKEFEPAEDVVAVLAFMPLFMALYFLFSLGAFLGQRTGALGMSIGAAVVAHALGALLVVPRFGAVGAAASITLSRLVQAAAMWGLARRAHPVRFDLGRMALGVLVAAGGTLAGRAIVWSGGSTGSSLAGRGGVFVVAAGLMVLLLVRGDELRRGPGGP